MYIYGVVRDLSYRIPKKIFRQVFLCVKCIEIRVVFLGLLDLLNLNTNPPTKHNYTSMLQFLDNHSSH